MGSMIKESNVSRAWAKALLEILKPGTKDIRPLTIAVHGMNPAQVEEDLVLKKKLDSALGSLNLLSNEQVAFTIFPQNLWVIVRNDRQKLYSVYDRAFPHYQVQNRKLNGRGLYFERLIRFNGEQPGSNQLEWIISQYNGRDGVRKSMFQAAIFDPNRDHVPDAQLVFPCLQHVSFVPDSTNLTVNAFYATQQLLNKAYGNYLGLARLGAFMASQMSLSSVSLNVFIGICKQDKLPKTDPIMQSLQQAAEQCITDSKDDDA